MKIIKYGKVIISQNQGRNPNIHDETPFFDIQGFHFNCEYGDDDEPLVWAWKALEKVIKEKLIGFTREGKKHNLITLEEHIKKSTEERELLKKFIKLMKSIKDEGEKNVN